VDFFEFHYPPSLFASIALETGYSSIEDGYGIERTTSFLLIDSPGNLVTFTLGLDRPTKVYILMRRQMI